MSALANIENSTIADYEREHAGDIDVDEAEVENRLQAIGDELVHAALTGSGIDGLLDDHREGDMPDLMADALRGVAHAVGAWRDTKGFGSSLFTDRERMAEMVCGIEKALAPLGRNAAEAQRDRVEQDVADAQRGGE